MYQKGFAMPEKIVLIGAGSAMFTRGLVADLIRQNQELELELVDIDPEALTVAEGLVRKMIEARGAPIHLSSAADRRVALPGATVVIATIAVGGREAWLQDVLIPRKYGIYQPVGDSVMPGGTSRALRMIPPMVAIAKDVLDLCPRALFFNYSNPMTPICRAIRKATGAPVVGLCHGVMEVARHLARLLGVGLGEMAYTAMGLNHLTWFTEVRVRGVDAQPRLREIAAEQLARLAAGETADQVSPFSWGLFQLFGAFPAVLDRHVSEFFPGMFPAGAYYGLQLGVDAYSLEDCIAWGEQIYQDMKAVALSAEPLPEDYFERLGGEHEQVIEIISAIRCDTAQVFSANLPNQGQIPNLPPEAVVEGPAVATAAGLRPLACPPLPSGLVGTLANRLSWGETVVEAALEGGREKFVQALVLDGAVPSLEVAGALADDLLQTQAAHLPQFRH
jgi:alpha-galactosidase